MRGREGVSLLQDELWGAVPSCLAWLCPQNLHAQRQKKPGCLGPPHPTGSLQPCGTNEEGEAQGRAASPRPPGKAGQSLGARLQGWCVVF